MRCEFDWSGLAWGSVATAHVWILHRVTWTSTTAASPRTDMRIWLFCPKPESDPGPWDRPVCMGGVWSYQIETANTTKFLGPEAAGRWWQDQGRNGLHILLHLHQSTRPGRGTFIFPVNIQDMWLYSDRWPVETWSSSSRGSWDLLLTVNGGMDYHQLPNCIWMLTRIHKPHE
jgi:hypothetical protein